MTALDFYFFEGYLKCKVCAAATENWKLTLQRNLKQIMVLHCCWLCGMLD